MEARFSGKVVHRVVGIRSFVLMLGVGIALSACASSGPTSPRGPSDAMTQSTVRFLEASNTGDLQAMARIFGSTAGSLADETGPAPRCALRSVGARMRISDPCPSWAEVELRMHAVARLLRHDHYRIGDPRVVPGRRAPTVQFLVDLDQGGRWIRDVPFQLVQRSDGRWMVEFIGLERITEASGP
jgi:hypothetical protein